MEKLVNTLIIGKVPIICSAIENIISKNLTESFSMSISELSAIVDLKDIVSFDLIIIDCDEYETEEMIILKEIKKITPNSKIVFFSFNEDISYINWCFKNGASIYLNKYSTEENLVKVINLMLNGDKYFVNDLIIKVPSLYLRNKNQSTKVKKKILSSREFEIAKLFVKGFTNKHISAKLNITESSVSTYKKRILTKTTSRNTLELYKKLRELIY